jgi:hypothetical protein
MRSNLTFLIVSCGKTVEGILAARPQHRCSKKAGKLNARKS